MPLATGQSLSFYEILGPLGAGGMGEVYRAKDTRLEREVAIKVLPEHFAEDEERLKRFEREAKTLATLHHPNVASIFGIDQDGDTCFLALELVQGEDLATWLARGRLPVDEALDVCRQIAEGLEAAHEAGVVHRDLKPANVRVTPSGEVKVLDFGLAKPLHPKSGKDGTPTAESDSFLMTEEGLVLGTPTYMSPEQARGKPVDRRSDVWAFGCVLYECLTGKRAFGGDSVTDVLAAIVEREPDWSPIPSDTPAHVRRLLRRCLDKDARTRLRDVGEARVALALPSDVDVAEPAQRPHALGRAFALGAVLASVVWAAASLLGGSADGDDVSTRGGAARALDLGVVRPDGRLPLLSPDGTRLAYSGTEGIMVRELSRPTADCVLASSDFLQLACWSPDGRSLAFLRDDVLETYQLGNARSEPRAAFTERPWVSDWGDDGSFLLEVSGSVDRKGLFLLAPGASTPERLDWIDPSSQLTPDLFWPTFLPGAREFLLTIRTEDGAWIHVASIEEKTLTPLVRGATRCEFVPPGWIAWCDVDRLLVQAFDPVTHELSGEPRELVRGVDGFLSTGSASFSFSDEGTLYHRSLQGDSRLEWVAPGGLRLGEAAPVGRYGGARLDRLGERLVLTIDNGETGSRDLWIRDLVRGVSTRVTSHERWVASPSWSPDGTRIAFLADWKGPPHVYLQELDGGVPTEIVPYDGTVHAVHGWTADGDAVIYGQRTPDGFDCWLVEIDGLARRPLRDTVFPAGDCELSRDGRWLAYVSSETGQSEVYVVSYPDLRGRTRVSTDGGSAPRWRRDAAELYYHSSSEGVFAVSFNTETGTAELPRLVVPDPGGDMLGFDAAPDGERFLVWSADRESREPPDRLITDWPRLLAR